MDNWVILLRNFQNVDLVVDQLEGSRDELLRNITDKEARLAEDEAKIRELQQKSKELELQRRSKEGELKSDEEVIRKWENRLKEIENHREYQVLIREIALAKRDNSVKEEEILKFLEEEDKIKKELKEKETLYALAKETVTKEKAAVMEKILSLEKNISEERTQLDGLRERCGNELLNKYERIRSRRNGPVLVQARDGVCQGCHMNIPHQVLNEVKRNTEMISCPNCQRILYWEETSVQPNAGH